MPLTAAQIAKGKAYYKNYFREIFLPETVKSRAGVKYVKYVKHYKKIIFDETLV